MILLGDNDKNSEIHLFFLDSFFWRGLANSSYNPVQKILENLSKLRKSCNHKRNINGIYNEKLHYNCLHQLPTLRHKTKDLRRLGNSGERK